MNWLLRAAALRFMASAPGGLRLYQLLQGRFGLYRNPTFLRSQMTWQSRLFRGVSEQGGSLVGSRILEVGTGWVPLAPVALWLLGAGRIYTYDLHRWFLPRLFSETLRWVLQSREELLELWGPLVAAETEGRFAILASHLDDPLGLLERAEIVYRAPADAAATGLPGESIDLHLSIQVLEHVLPRVYPRLLEEAARVLRPGGMAAHFVDPSDHFSHFDKRLPSVHFLRFSRAAWRAIAGNDLAFHNRLRVADHLALFSASPLRLLHSESRLDSGARKALEMELRVAPEFRQVGWEQLSRRDLFIYAVKG